MGYNDNGKWLSTKLVDMFGNEFKVGDKVARAVMVGRSPNIEVSEVTRIENDYMYLDNSKVAIRYPGRLMIITSMFEN